MTEIYVDNSLNIPEETLKNISKILTGNAKPDIKYPVKKETKADERRRKSHNRRRKQ